MTTISALGKALLCLNLMLLNVLSVMTVMPTCHIIDTIISTISSPQNFLLSKALRYPTRQWPRGLIVILFLLGKNTILFLLIIDGFGQSQMPIVSFNMKCQHWPEELRVFCNSNHNLPPQMSVAVFKATVNAPPERCKQADTPHLDTIHLQTTI